MKPKAKLNELDLKMVEELAGLGLTEEEIGRVLGVTRECIRLWKKKSPAFGEAMVAGKLKADTAVVKRLYEKALSGDTTAIIFWLKNRRRDQWLDQYFHGLNFLKDIKLKFEYENGKEDEE